MKATKGFSIMLCFGSYGGFYITTGHSTLRFCFGWVALTFYGYDFENVIANILKL